MSNRIVIGEVRLSFPNLFAPRKLSAEDITKGIEPKYDVCILIPKSNPELSQRINAAVEAEKNTERGRKILEGVPVGKLNHPLRDGDTEIDLTKFPEFAGHWYMNLRSKSKPEVVHRDASGAQVQVIDPSDVYAGCYAYVSMDFYSYNNKAAGVNAGLGNVLKTRDAEPFGAVGPSAEEDFGSIVISAPPAAAGGFGQQPPAESYAPPAHQNAPTYYPGGFGQQPPAQTPPAQTTMPGSDLLG